MHRACKSIRSKDKSLKLSMYVYLSGSQLAFAEAAATLSVVHRQSNSQAPSVLKDRA